MDGTKIEASANKYSFVWAKSIQNCDRKLDEKIKNYLREIDRILAEKNQIYLEEKGENESCHRTDLWAVQGLLSIARNFTKMALEG